MLSRRFRFVGASLAGPRMEEISKRAWHSAFAPPAESRASTPDMTAADREALAHVTGLLRAYYQTLLVEPTAGAAARAARRDRRRLEVTGRGGTVATQRRGIRG
jgi:hypothetical protein